MPSMQQVRIHDVNDIRMDTVNLPQPGPDDIVVQVKNCGICGSDLGYAASGGIMGPGSPMAIGHEFSGTIYQTGESVSHLKLGQRVVINPEANGNGIGGLAFTEAAFAPYVLVKNVTGDETAVFALDESLDFEHGALVEPLSVGLHGLKRGRYCADDKLAIFGAGPIGLGIVLLARHAGLQDIVVVDLSDHRLKLAEELGATGLRGDASDLAERLIQHHGEAQVMGSPVPATTLFIEATGVGPVLQKLITLACRGARISLIGVHKSTIEINPLDLLIREIDLCGSMAYNTEFAEVLNILQSQTFDPRVLISHRFALSDFDAAFAQAKMQDQATKVMIDCQQ